jgi:phosphoglycolate phosphatase
MTKTRPILVFDLDGTLAETAGDLVGTLNAILRREGLRPLDLARARKLIGGGARLLIARGFAEEGRALAPDRLESLYRDFIAHYEQRIAEESHLYPGVERALARFAKADYALAVCTNKLEKSSRLLLRALEVDDRFQAICGQDTFGVAKPDPRVLRETIAKARGDLGRAVMVGDSSTDIETARAAGVPVVAVDFGYTDKPIEEYRPDRVISHFDQLWEAVAALRSGAGADAP